MKYTRLSFQEYFIICSQNYNKHTTVEEIAEYEEIIYQHKNHTHKANFQVRYDKNRDCIQVIFQQTADKSDWKANFEFPKKIYDKVTFDNKIIQLKVHGGWGDMWLACQDIIRKKIKSLLDIYPESHIEVFGWSLGSGIAQLAAEDIYFKFNKKVHLFTFGSVKPFFGKKTLNYVRQSCIEAYNFYDHCDIVGYMVPFIGWNAINHVKLKGEIFCISKLFNPWKFHTQYDNCELYKNIK